MSNCTMQLVAALAEEYANVGGDLLPSATMIGTS